MKVGIVGPTYNQLSLPFDAQRAINCYPILDQMGKEVAAMYGTPGLTLFGAIGTGPQRGEFFSLSTDRAFCISGSGFYEVAVNGTGTLRGTLKSSNGNVFIVENPVQVAICDGQYLYVMDYATNTFTLVQGGIEYTQNGTFASDTLWTKGSGWTISGGFAKASAASSALTQNALASAPIVSGKTYTLSYTVDLASYVTNGTFDADTGWTKGAGWTIGGGTAKAVLSGAALSQTTPQALVNTKTYVVTYTILNFSAGSVAVSLGGGAAGTARNANGTYTETITAGATQILAFTGTGFSGQIDGVAVYIDGSGSVTASIGGTSGIPRSTQGSFIETIVAGATQAITFTGFGFTGNIGSVSINDQSTGLPVAVGTLDFIDSFFIVSDYHTGRFYKSAPNNGLSWNALDFANAESSPDDLVCVKAAVGQLWLLGSKTTEIWTNTGAALFPFQKISGGKMTMGILAASTAMELDNTLFWIGKNEGGGGVVYRANGFIPRRISTEPIEIQIRKASDPTNIRAWSYQQDGHVYYVLTGGGLATSLVFDLTTEMWHERAYMNSQGVFEQHLGACYMNAFNKHLVGDRNNGNIYSIDVDSYTDNGDPLIFRRVYTHLHDEAKTLRYNELVIGVETGVGIQTGQGKDPVIGLRLSKDGARTFIDMGVKPIGSAGKYEEKVEFRRLGVARQMTFEVTISDPVKRAITGSYLQ